MWLKYCENHSVLKAFTAANSPKNHFVSMPRTIQRRKKLAQKVTFNKISSMLLRALQKCFGMPCFLNKINVVDNL